MINPTIDDLKNLIQSDMEQARRRLNHISERGDLGKALYAKMIRFLELYYATMLADHTLTTLAYGETQRSRNMAATGHPDPTIELAFVLQSPSHLQANCIVLGIATGYVTEAQMAENLKQDDVTTADALADWLTRLRANLTDATQLHHVARAIGRGLLAGLEDFLADSERLFMVHTPQHTQLACIVPIGDRWQLYSMELAIPAMLQYIMTEMMLSAGQSTQSDSVH